MIEIDLIKKYYKVGDRIQIEYGGSNKVINGELIDFGKSSIVIKNSHGDPFTIGELHINNIQRLRTATEESMKILKEEGMQEKDVHEEDVEEEYIEEGDVKEGDVEEDVKEEGVQEKDVQEKDVHEEDVEEEDVEEEDVKEEDVKEEGVQEKDVHEEDVEEGDVEKEDVKEDKTGIFRIKHVLQGIKQVGFMDLSKFDNKTRPDKKSKKEKALEREQKNKDYLNNLNKNEQENIKEQEKSVNELIQRGEINEALEIIEKILENKDLPIKYKSSFLLKKAQTYSSLRDYSKAKEAYIDLIAFNEKHNKEAKNLSHLYTELARLQSMNGLEISEAIISTQKALEYNKNNTVATTLLEQLKNGIVNNNYILFNEGTEGDEELILDSDENTTAISKMIDIDIKEHKYTNEKIISNGGIPTPNIAQQILNEAKKTTEVDLSERYPVYLEAAKAFSDLPVGSYDTQNYLESVAYYAILKGNSLYLNFRNQILKGNTDVKELTILKDSACSYYIESLNLLSNIPGNYHLSILRNYLKMYKAICDLKNNRVINFSGQFDKIFFSCLSSENIEYNEIVWMVIIEVGTASAGAWNRLCRLKGGIGGLYSAMKDNKRRKHYYATINKLGGAEIDKELLPGEFLRQTFSFRKNRSAQFSKFCNNILKENFDVHTISSTIELWKKIEQYKDLLSETDIESLETTYKILQILSPYINRNQTERTNILIQVQRILEKQISFINENTTYYGRTLFFPLYNKWKSNIQNLLDKKIADTLPILQVYADPPYIITNGEDKIVNLIIKNVGESTAEGCVLIPTISETNSQSVAKSRNEYKSEIPSGKSLNIPLNLPTNLKEAKSINLSISIIAIYQGKENDAKEYSFTIEKEPESTLTLEEIPWADGKIPKEQMFKGREQILKTLFQHYTSLDKDKPYILYGLTRTGKSSILRYLQKSLDKKQFYSSSKLVTMSTFTWNLSEAASFGNAQDMWQYLLYNQIYCKLDKYLDDESIHKLKFTEKPRSKDFSSLLHFLNMNNLYPLFLVDEFSFIKVLMDNKIINPAFLHTLREFSLEGIASFVYAGTYDIKELIVDPKYGITGQLVNAVEKQISEIDNDSAEDLINVIDNKLKFTKDAITHIHKLTGDIPYFIQMVCKYCAIYAVEKKRSIIGYPELEHIIKILTGEIECDPQSKVQVLPENVFQNNMYNPADTKEVNVLISSIAYINRHNIENPVGVSTPNLQELWASKGIADYRPKIAEAISVLLQKKVLYSQEDEGMPVYKITVDLFRRWWWQHYSDINREIDKIV